MTTKTAHGGPRAGAGRPRNPPPPVLDATAPLAFLLAVMRDTTQTVSRRMRAAVAALPYTNAKMAAGKKVDIANAASRATNGRFAPSPVPPRLVVSNRATPT